MKKGLYLLLVVLLVVGLFAVGCSTAEEPAPEETAAETTTAAPATEEPATGEKEIAKQIVIGRIQDSDDLDPVTQDGNVNIWMFNLVLESLLKTSDDGTMIEPGLAETWEVSEDGLTYTFHLKEGVMFSNGTPVTGEDWVWSLKRAAAEDSTWKFAAADIVEVEAPDDLTVVVTIGEPLATMEANLSMFNMVVQSKAYYEEVGQEVYSQGPIGTGPYAFSEWEKGEYILMTKNPYYHMEGLPKTDEIKFVVIPDDNTRALQLEAGQIDVATFVPFTRMAELDAKDDLVAYGIPSTETRYVVFNNNNPKFADQKARLAFQYATDKQEIVDFILYGYGSIATSYAPPAGLFYNYDLVDYGYDPEKAKELLAEAGYPDGMEVELLVRSGNVVYEQLAVILKEQWAKSGVTVNILALESATAVAKYRAMEHEVTLSGWTNDMNDPSQQAVYVFDVTAAHNYYTDWESARAVELKDAAVRELDLAKREAMYLELQEIHFAEVPMMPVFHSSYPVAMSTSVEGFVQTPLGNYRFENLVKYVD